jgi:hypothetical protein
MDRGSIFLGCHKPHTTHDDITVVGFSLFVLSDMSKSELSADEFLSDLSKPRSWKFLQVIGSV